MATFVGRLIAFSLICGAINLQAATVLTVNWAAATDNGFGLADGTTALPVGNEVRLGSFDFADATLDNDVRSRLNSGNLVDLLSHFIFFDTANIGTSAFAGNLGQVPLSSRSGLFEKSSGAVTLPDSSPLFNKQMFLWVFKTTGNNAVASNFSNVTQTGVFSNNTTGWFFPGNNGANGTAESRPIEITNLTAASSATLAGTARLVYGGFSAQPVTLATGNHKVFTLTAVPEPVSSVLILCSLSAALLRRPRRRQG